VNVEAIDMASKTPNSNLEIFLLACFWDHVSIEFIERLVRRKGPEDKASSQIQIKTRPGIAGSAVFAQQSDYGLSPAANQPPGILPYQK
jgi:hypothetical protein